MGRAVALTVARRRLTPRRGTGALLGLALAAGIVVPAGSAPPRLAEPMFPPLTGAETPHAQLVRFLNELGHRALRDRERALAGVTTREQLEVWKQRARGSFLDLIGGLPERRTPLEARTVGRRQADGFSVENVVFESLPGFPVTANLYRPPGPGPFPAILASMGHGEGKSGERQGPDLARKGFVVLAYDPLGQGERLQHYDAELRVSRAGGATDEHGQAAVRAELIGDSVARYFVWDAIRGLDYLAGRPDVDATRLGATGCSGGGTATAYLAALDARVKAAAIACYVTSWDALLDGPGPQEAEQSVAGFLAHGLDMGDFVALIAPRPLLIVSTRDDFFPLAGARAVYEEGRRHYRLYDAVDNISWSVGPGGHGTHREGREAIAEFFLRQFRGGQGDPRDEPDARLDAEDLACTETGQVSTSLHARSVADLVLERAGRILPARPEPPSDAVALERHKVRIREAVVRLAGLAPRPERPAPALSVHGSQQRDGYRLDTVSFVEDGVARWGLLAVPETAGRKPAALLADPQLRGGAAEPGSDLDALARAGRVVLALELRGTLLDAELPSRPSLLGPYAPLQRRAAVVGRSLVGQRAEDVGRGIDLLAERGDVAPGGIAGYAVGGFAVPMLHAAVLDERLGRVTLQDAPATYRGVLEHSIHKNLPEVVVPGVLREYDLDDLVLALAPRPVTLLNPGDAVGQPLTRRGVEQVLGPMRDASRRCGGSVTIASRRRGEPLRWE